MQCMSKCTFIKLLITMQIFNATIRSLTFLKIAIEVSDTMYVFMHLCQTINYDATTRSLTSFKVTIEVSDVMYVLIHFCKTSNYNAYFRCNAYLRVSRSHIVITLQVPDATHVSTTLSYTY